ncbi:MAG: hypothetical protein KKE08_18840 [Gammaproteobacteria bacterium]|nr:hypothetical protein [Gammaproteobacteria bacterium]MBU2185086.1 hypothetical protein [Gammaproteobacteria bacterium]MBU2206954.1 hypothetical protein [Gammaproteobacteria bacterium]
MMDNKHFVKVTALDVEAGVVEAAINGNKIKVPLTAHSLANGIRLKKLGNVPVDLLIEFYPDVRSFESAATQHPNVPGHWFVSGTSKSHDSVDTSEHVTKPQGSRFADKPLLKAILVGAICVAGLFAFYHPENGDHTLDDKAQIIDSGNQPDEQQYRALRQDVTQNAKAAQDFAKAIYEQALQAVATVIQNYNASALSDLEDDELQQAWQYLVSDNVEADRYWQTVDKLLPALGDVDLHKDSCTVGLARCVTELNALNQSITKQHSQLKDIQSAMSFYIASTLLFRDRIKFSDNFVRQESFKTVQNAFNSMPMPTSLAQVKSQEKPLNDITATVMFLVETFQDMESCRKQASSSCSGSEVSRILEQVKKYQAWGHPAAMQQAFKQVDRMLFPLIERQLLLGNQMSVGSYAMAAQFVTTMWPYTDTTKLNEALKQQEVMAWISVLRNSPDNALTAAVHEASYKTARAKNTIDGYLDFLDMWETSEHQDDINRRLAAVPEQTAQRRSARAAKKQQQTQKKEELQRLWEQYQKYTFYCLAQDAEETTYVLNAWQHGQFYLYDPRPDDGKALLQALCSEVVSKCEEEYGDCYVVEKGKKLLSEVDNEMDIDDTEQYQEDKRRARRASRHDYADDDDQVVVDKSQMDDSRYTCIAESNSYRASATTAWSTGAACEQAMNTCRSMSKWGDACREVRSWRSR